MGQILSEPVTSKESHCLHDDRLVVGSSCMQGWRLSMEDAHTHILQMPKDKDASFFAVFDGHGGSKVSEFASRHLHRLLTERPEYASGDVCQALAAAILQLDELMLQDETLRDCQSGSTVNAVLIKNHRLYCANVGDSRAIACVNGDVDLLSTDHKPSNKCEAERIVTAGGWVEANRVNGNLALSRAVGDFMFKRNAAKDARNQIVTAFPDVEVRQITDDWLFVVLACDGIWDVLTNEEVVEFVLCRLSSGLSPDVICEQLMMRCLAPDSFMSGLGCDNMTVILVCFLADGCAESLHTRCRQLLASSAASHAARGSMDGSGELPPGAEHSETESDDD